MTETIMSFKPTPKRKCPKCLRVNDLTVSFKGSMYGKWCFYCFIDWVSVHVPQLEEVKQEQEKV